MAEKLTAKTATWEDVDEALDRLCELDSARNYHTRQLNVAIDEARALCQPSLDDIANEDAQLRENVERFAREHPQDFSPQKTIERMHGILSFRTTPPAVKVLRRPWTDEERIQRVRQVLGDQCIRVTEDIAKDVVLNETAQGIHSAAQLAEAGLRIGQREVFSLDLKRDAAPPTTFGAKV